MSRIGSKPISVPKGTEVSVDGSRVTVKGPKGELSEVFSSEMVIELTGEQLTVKSSSDEKKQKALHGLTARLIANMFEGVTKGYAKSLEIHGVGYRAVKQGGSLVLDVGYSHLVNIAPVEGIEIEVPSNDKVIVRGIDKQKVGDLAASIRRVAPPEPYKGKGIRYEGERVRRKVGKSGK